MAFDHAKRHAEYEALPDWARKMVDLCHKAIAHGFGNEKGPLGGDCAKIIFKRNDGNACEMSIAIGEMMTFANSLTAPPPSADIEMPEMRADNIVEAISDGDCAFDQPCRYGHRVEYHAVYCHNAAWPDSPRKCRRGKGCAEVYGIPEEENLHEDCPGFAPNPLFGQPQVTGEA